MKKLLRGTLDLLKLGLVGLVFLLMLPVLFLFEMGELVFVSPKRKRELLEKQLQEARERLAHVEEQYERMTAFFVSQGGTAKELLQGLKKPFVREKKE